MSDRRWKKQMMRTRMAAAAVAATMVLGGAACGGDELSSCEDVADEAINVVQGALDETSDMSTEDTASGEQPAFVQDLQDDINRLGSTAEELGCSEEEITSLFAERASELDASGPVSERLLEAVRSGDIF